MYLLRPNVSKLRTNILESSNKVIGDVVGDVAAKLQCGYFSVSTLEGV